MQKRTHNTQLIKNQQLDFSNSLTCLKSSGVPSIVTQFCVLCHGRYLLHVLHLLENHHDVCWSVLHFTSLPVCELFISP